MELAPAVCRNWLAYLGGEKCHGTDEYAVFNDSYACGELGQRERQHVTEPYDFIALLLLCIGIRLESGGAT